MSSETEPNLSSSAKLTSEKSDHFLNYSFHELRTPLTVIYTYAQLAADKLPAGEDFTPLRKIIRQMLEQSEELEEMLEEFLEASRLQTRQVELDLVELDLRESCQQTLANLKKGQQQRVILNMPAGSQPCLVRSDGSRLELALTLLLELGLKVAELEPLSLTLIEQAHSEPSSFLISLIIPGLEIAQAEHEEIFKVNFVPERPYTSLKSGRSGVGLYIAYSIIIAHGGSLAYNPVLPGFELKLDAIAPRLELD
jgi:signal transduction histidine kinase